MRVKPVDSTDKLYRENRGLIGRCIRGIQIPDYCTLEDLEQAGSIGLLEAIRNYRPEKNVQFSTFAYYYIKGYILREVYRNISIFSPKRLGDSAFKKKLIVYPAIIPIDIDDEDTPYIQVSSKDDINDIDVKMDYYRLKKLYDIFFKCLTPQQKKALELRYFTLNDNGSRLTFEETANIMGVSKQRVYQLIYSGQKALKNRFGGHLDVYI